MLRRIPAGRGKASGFGYRRARSKLLYPRKVRNENNESNEGNERIS